MVFTRSENEINMISKSCQIVADTIDMLSEFVIPGVMFLYITGWIGWVGRKYLLFTKTTCKPAEKEIIIE